LPGHCRPLCCKGEPASAFASRQVRPLWARFRYLVAKPLRGSPPNLLQRFTQLLAFGLTSRSRCFHAGSIVVKAHIQSEHDDRTVGEGPRADRGKNEKTDLGNQHLHGFASAKWTPERRRDLWVAASGLSRLLRNWSSPRRIWLSATGAPAVGGWPFGQSFPRAVGSGYPGTVASRLFAEPRRLSDQTRAALSGEIAPHPLALDPEPILQLWQKEQVNKGPGAPGG
jgi:hypothetical protein